MSVSFFAYRLYFFHFDRFCQVDIATTCVPPTDFISFSLPQITQIYPFDPCHPQSKKLFILRSVRSVRSVFKKIKTPFTSFYSACKKINLRKILVLNSRLEFSLCESIEIDFFWWRREVFQLALDVNLVTWIGVANSGTWIILSHAGWNEIRSIRVIRVRKK